MPTRHVELTEQQERAIDAPVRSGRHQSAGEVVREDLRSVVDREAGDAAKLAALRAAVDVGIAAIERGEFRTFADASEIAAYFREISDKAAAQLRRQ